MEHLHTEKTKADYKERAEFILERMDLSWDEIKEKDVIDIGSGTSSIARAADSIDFEVSISSVDFKVSPKWAELPWGDRQPPVQAEAENLPFKDASFDYAIMHASAATPQGISEAARVLREGGELRIYPIAGIMLEFWYIGAYLHEVRGLPEDEINTLLGNFDRQIIEADGWTSKEYNDLKDEALNVLTQEQKLGVIDTMVVKYSELSGIPLSYKVTNPESQEPNALLTYKKT